MTRNQGLRRFRAMWRWLSKHPKAEKYDYPKWKWNGGKYEDEYGSRCFLCNLKGCNDTCAVKWPGDCCLLADSPFKAWETAKGSERSKLALQISKLPSQRLRE